MKIKLLPLLALCACAHAQPRPPTFQELSATLERDPELATLIATRGHRLGQPTAVQITPDGKTVLFLQSGPRSDVRALHAFDVGTGTDRVFATAEMLAGAGADPKLSKAEAAQRERMRLTARGIGTYELSRDGRLALVPLGDHLYAIDVPSGTVHPLSSAGKGAFDPRLSPDATQVAFVRDQEVYVQSLAGGVEHKLTSGAGGSISHGTAEFVAQEEMDRFYGTFWSPDSRLLAYEEADTKDVETFYVSDPLHGTDPPDGSPYPRPGHPNAKVRLGIVAAKGGPTTWVKWDAERYPYLARVDWEKDSPLFIQVLTRNQRDLLLLEVDPKTGTTSQRLAEHDDDWLELTNDFRWISGQGFLWSSERTDQRNLELHAPSGELLRTLTTDALGFRSVIEVDAADKQVLVEASADPTRQQIVSVPLAGGAASSPTPVVAGDGVATGRASIDGRFLIAFEDHPAALPEATLRDASGKKLGVLPSQMEAIAALPRVEFVELSLPQGKLEASVVLPRWAKPGDKLPIVDYVYGGPTLALVQRTALRFSLAQWMADQGCAVVTIDNRGTPNHGRAFARAIRKNFADVTLADQADGVEALAKANPMLDLTRVGITGGSFGGYLSALAVLKRPDRFEAGAAAAPVTDWLEYDTTYTERYLGLPSENPKGYEQSSLIPYAAGLRRPLLLTHGVADDNVHVGNTLELVSALEQAGHAPSLFLVPSQTHMFADRPTQQMMEATIVAFLLDALRDP